jgi:hypothetical protein
VTGDFYVIYCHRVFRQSKPGDWGEVVDRVARELAATEAVAAE